MMKPLLIALGVMLAGTVSADEGMWLFTAPPREALREQYGFIPSEEWLGHLQRASIRFNSGGSGSFVSANGLILTNHHVAREHIYQVSSGERDLTETGFYAARPEDELKVPGLELNVLVSIEDVTERVNAAVTDAMNADEANAARRSRMAEIESESLEATGLRSDVVTLYRGGAYHLYRYKRYTDVRLVMAPEDMIGYFGGDPDNFDYPRYTLDFTFFRAWEDGKPARVADYLRWSSKPLAEGDLVFASGNPGSTARLMTLNQLENRRDVILPAQMRGIYRLETALSVHSMFSPEHARRAKDPLFFIQNSRKALGGAYDGLLGRDIIERKRREEAALREAIASRADLAAAVDAWDRVDAAMAEIQKVRLDYTNLEAPRFNWSQLFADARTLYRGAAERQKPSGDRLREFRESNLQSIEDRLFAELPVYDDIERIFMEGFLTDLARELGVEHPVVQAALAGMPPSERAAELVAKSRLHDAAARRALWEGGADAVAAADDAMIALVAALDEPAREARAVVEAHDEVISRALGDIARARFALYGASVYPDATFTLRLSVGTVQGVTIAGEDLPWGTTFAGMASVAGTQDRYKLPEDWQQQLPKLPHDVPVNFLSTNDIIGGNSGSPLVNRDGELVGLVFDGNLPSLTWDYLFSDSTGRTINVGAQAILTALESVYGYETLLEEIRGK